MKSVVETFADSLNNLIARNKHLERENSELKRRNDDYFRELHPDVARMQDENMLDNEIRLLREQG